MPLNPRWDRLWKFYIIKDAKIEEFDLIISKPFWSDFESFRKSAANDYEEQMLLFSFGFENQLFVIISIFLSTFTQFFLGDLHKHSPV